MFSRIRWRLTMGYVGILALILLLFGVVVVNIYSWQVTEQQNELLERTAASMAKNLAYMEEGRGALGDEPGSFAWVTLTPDTTAVVNSTPESSSLDLPQRALAGEAVRAGSTQLSYFERRDGEVVWVASAPMTLATRESSEGAPCSNFVAAGSPSRNLRSDSSIGSRLSIVEPGARESVPGL